MIDYLKRAVAGCVCLISLASIGAFGSERDRQADPRVLLLKTLLGIPICVASFAWLNPVRPRTAPADFDDPSGCSLGEASESPVGHESADWSRPSYLGRCRNVEHPDFLGSRVPAKGPRTAAASAGRPWATQATTIVC